MKSEPTEKTKGKKMAVSETADRKNGRSPGAGHDEWWERLMMEPGPGESAGTDASVTESMIPSGLVAEEVSGEARRKDTPPEPEDPVRRRTSGRQRRASLEEYRETYLTVPKIRNRILPPTVGTSSSGEKSDSLLPGVEYTRCMHCSLYTRFNVENAGGDFSVGGARVCFRIPENPCSPRPAVAGRVNPLPPVADFGMKEVRTKKKKHMTNDVNGMKKKCGRPALGRTRKLTRGVTVKFSPVSYEALRFRAGKSGRSLAVYIREAALAATVTARHTPEENALLRSLAGMANNLNQLTKLSHQTGFYRTRLLIEGLLGKLKRIMDDYRPKGG